MMQRIFFQTVSRIRCKTNFFSNQYLQRKLSSALHIRSDDNDINRERDMFQSIVEEMNKKKLNVYLPNVFARVSLCESLKLSF